MKNINKTLVQKAELLDTLKTNRIDILMTLGAGDIDVLVPKIEKQLKEWL